MPELVDNGAELFDFRGKGGRVDDSGLFFGEEATEFLRDARLTLISGDSKGLVFGSY